MLVIHQFHLSSYLFYRIKIYVQQANQEFSSIQWWFHIIRFFHLIMESKDLNQPN